MCEEKKKSYRKLKRIIDSFAFEAKVKYTDWDMKEIVEIRMSASCFVRKQSCISRVKKEIEKNNFPFKVEERKEHEQNNFFVIVF